MICSLRKQSAASRGIRKEMEKEKYVARKGSS